MAEGQGGGRPPLLVVVGPTAVGKTAVAIRLAEALDGRIISADSRQVYVGMDIGTAKPSPAELARAPHALVDILRPDERLTLAEYQDRAYAAIEAAHAAGRLPILVGGTGQYVRAVVEGWGIPRVPPRPGRRADLTGMAYLYGPSVLHAWLADVDPAAAGAIDYRNVRRVVRALEVYIVSGEPISVQQERHPPPYRILQIGLTRPRESLYRRIDARVDRMIADGLVGEIKKLLAAGYGWDQSSMSSLGYRQFAPYLAGEASLEEAAQAVRSETRRFVRQQATWFRRDDSAITWFDLDEVGFEEILNAVREWLTGGG